MQGLGRSDKLLLAALKSVELKRDIESRNLKLERDDRAGGWLSIWCAVVRPWIQLPGLANVWLWVSGGG